MKHSLWRIFPWLLMLGLSGCEEQNIPRATPGDYFPLSDDQQWRYQRRYANGPNDTLVWILDTLTLRVQGDVEINGKSYKRIIDKHGSVDKIVRVEGSRYFGRNHELYGDFSHEYVFLDTDKPAGESWSYLKDDGYSKTEYVVLSTDATHAILGIVYNDVIEVQVSYYRQVKPGRYELWATALHYYAKGVGEIFHYYPYPISSAYDNISAFIMNE